MIEFLQIMLLPFLACLILTGIHAYLGLHVIERQVIFVDLALAQIAVLGASVGLLMGYADHSFPGYLFSLGFTVAGAAVFALTRFQKQRIPHEAIIGIVYVISASLMLIILDLSGEGTEHIRQSLIGDILLVRSADLWKLLLIYIPVGVLHFAFRRQFYLITRHPDKAFEQGLKVRGWDFLFYTTFGLVLTSSVQIAGVLLVFSFLVIPAVCAMLIFDDLKHRLFLGWIIGSVGSVLGMAASYFLDLPTGASVVCMFGLILMVTAGVTALKQRR